MKIQVSKNLILSDWKYGHSGFWYRDIDSGTPTFGTMVPRGPDVRYVSVLLMSADDRFLWVPTFEKVSGLHDLHNPCFLIDKEKDAKAYVDEFNRPCGEDFGLHMKVGKYELENWSYREYNDAKYRKGFAWYRFATIDPHRLEACVAIYNWYSLWQFGVMAPTKNIEAHDSLVWEPSFHYRFQYLQPVYEKAYSEESRSTLLMMTENEAKVVMDERLERIANLLAFA